MEGVMKTRISGKEAVQVAEDMAKPGPIRVVEPREVQEAAGALVPSAGAELDRKVPPRVRKPLPRNDQWKAPTPDLEGHRQRLREALGNTLSDEFVDVILGKLVEALRPGLYDQLEEATLNAALATIDSMQPRSELQALLAVQIIATGFAGLVSSAIRWVQRFRENGTFEPMPSGGSTSPLEKYSRQILALISEESGLWSGERSIRAITPDPPTERTKTIIPGNANNAVRVFGH